MKGQPLRFIRGHTSPEVRAKISAAKRGRSCSATTRAKISRSLTGRRDPPSVRAKKLANAQRGASSPVWVGSDASYNAVHNRARKTLPFECELADGTCKGVLEVALRVGLPAAEIRVSPRGHAYYVGANIADGYARLCRSHHRRYDQH